MNYAWKLLAAAGMWLLGREYVSWNDLPSGSEKHSLATWDARNKRWTRIVLKRCSKEWSWGSWQPPFAIHLCIWMPVHKVGVRAIHYVDSRAVLWLQKQKHACADIHICPQKRLGGSKVGRMLFFKYLNGVIIILSSLDRIKGQIRC